MRAGSILVVVISFLAITGCASTKKLPTYRYYNMDGYLVEVEDGKVIRKTDVYPHWRKNKYYRQRPTAATLVPPKETQLDRIERRQLEIDRRQRQMEIQMDWMELQQMNSDNFGIGF